MVVCFMITIALLPVVHFVKNVKVFGLHSHEYPTSHPCRASSTSWSFTRLSHAGTKVQLDGAVV
jgi:hypothetical protein